MISYTQEDQTILFDPFCGWNRKHPCFAPEDLSLCRHIFITHGHFDHILDTPEVMAQNKALVHCSGTAAKTLIRRGVNPDRIKITAPGDAIEDGPFAIRVLAGKHIVFDFKLIWTTIFNTRMMRHFGNLLRIIRTTFQCKEGQTLIYDIACGGKKLLHLGSLNFAHGEQYPQDVDILVLPFQGRSDMAAYALAAVSKIKPGSVYLHHFDDAFPPISRTVETRDFIRRVQKDFPAIRIIVPERGKGQTV